MAAILEQAHSRHVFIMTSICNTNKCSDLLQFTVLNANKSKHNGWNVGVKH